MIKRLKAINVDGKWFVAQGNKTHYPNTECDTQAQAEEKAFLWMMQDAFEIAQHFYQKGVEKGYFEENSFEDYLV